MDAISGAGMGMGITGMVSDMFDAGLTARFNAKESKKGRNFAEAVGKNRVRWAVNDMKRAGINPLTAFMGGGGISGGASGGAGVASVARSPGSVRSAAEAGRAVAGAKRETAEAAAKREMLDLIQAQAEAARTAAQKDRDQGQLFFFQGHESKARAEYYKKLSEVEGFNATLRELEIPGARNRASVEETAFGEAMRYLQRFGDAIPSWKIDLNTGGGRKPYVPKPRPNNRKHRGY